MGQGDRFLSNTRFLGTHSSILQGAVGSAYINGDGGIIDLTGASATAYVFAINILAATKFQVLENLDGAMGSLSTVTAENDWDGTGGFGAGANNTNYTAGSGGFEFPVNHWIYGKWDKVELHAGRVLCYIALK